MRHGRRVTRVNRSGVFTRWLIGTERRTVPRTAVNRPGKFNRVVNHAVGRLELQRTRRSPGLRADEGDASRGPGAGQDRPPDARQPSQNLGCDRRGHESNHASRQDLICGAEVGGPLRRTHRSERRREPTDQTRFAQNSIASQARRGATKTQDYTLAQPERMQAQFGGLCLWSNPQLGDRTLELATVRCLVVADHGVESGFDSRTPQSAPGTRRMFHRGSFTQGAKTGRPSFGFFPSSGRLRTSGRPCFPKVTGAR